MASRKKPSARSTTRTKVIAHRDWSLEDLVCRLTLVTQGSLRLKRVLYNVENVVKVVEKGKPEVALFTLPQHRLSVDDMEYLDREFQQVINDAVMARVALHSLMTLQSTMVPKKRTR